MKNAFNEVSRASIIEALESEPSLQHLASFAAVVLAAGSGLEHAGRLWGETEEGETQGDPKASPFFCVSWHKYVRELDEEVKGSGGMARFGMDDGYVLGPAEVVFPAMERFSESVRRFCHLQLERTKTQTFTWDATLPLETPDGLTLAGEEVDGNFEPGFLCYGVSVGTDMWHI